MRAAATHRSPTPADRPWLLGLFISAVPGREFLPPELLLVQEAMQRSQWSALWGDAGETIVEFDGGPAARMWVAFRPSAIRLVELCVAPEFRRRGLARRLLAGLCDAADAAGLTMELAVDVPNVAARRLYESLGFHVSAETDCGSVLSLAMVRAPTETKNPMIQLKQDADGFVRMSRHFPAKTAISITFTDGTTGDYSGKRMNELYDAALAAFRLGNNMDAKGFNRNSKKIHRRNAVDLVPVRSGMPA